MARDAAPVHTGSSQCPTSDTGFWRDHGLTFKLANKLQFARPLLNEKIEVKVSGGVAILSGNLSSNQKIADAHRLAADTDGIRCVQRYLKVGPPVQE